MKTILIILLFITIGLPLFSFEGGAGLSVFVPETLYKYGTGSISIEQKLSTAIGLNDYISFPVGITYHHADGYVIKDDSLYSIKGPSVYGDSLSIFATAELKIPVSVFYFKISGGALVNWIFVTRPYTGFFDRSLSSTGSSAVDSYTLEPTTGFGWTAGGAAGIKAGQFSIDIGIAYRSVIHPLSLDARGYELDGGTVTGPIMIATDKAHLILRGVAVALKASVVF